MPFGSVKLAGGSEANVVCASAPTGARRDTRVARTETNRKEDIMILVKVPANMRGTAPASYTARNGSLRHKPEIDSWRRTTSKIVNTQLGQFRIVADI
jgi:hypothetical protein